MHVNKYLTINGRAYDCVYVYPAQRAISCKDYVCSPQRLQPLVSYNFYAYALTPLTSYVGTQRPSYRRLSSVRCLCREDEGDVCCLSRKNTDGNPAETSSFVHLPSCYMRGDAIGYHVSEICIFPQVLSMQPKLKKKCCQEALRGRISATNSVTLNLRHSALVLFRY